MRDVCNAAVEGAPVHHGVPLQYVVVIKYVHDGRRAMEDAEAAARSSRATSFCLIKYVPG